MNIHGQHFLCSQINLLLPREASGTSAYCNVPRDSHFALLLNQERVQSFSVSWMLNIQRKRLLFTRKHLFPKFFFLLLTATSFQPFFLDDCTMSSQWNYIREMRLYVVIIYLCEGQTKLPSHEQDLQAGNSGREGWGTQVCCGLSVLEEGL